MIEVESLAHKKFVLNSDHIEKMEEVPETVITLVNGKKYLVRESLQEVIDKVIEYKRKLYNKD